MDANCRICKGARWVCEDHLDKPWGGASVIPKLATAEVRERHVLPAIQAMGSIGRS